MTRRQKRLRRAVARRPFRRFGIYMVTATGNAGEPFVARRVITAKERIG
jgi:hypothetical protein